MSGAATPAGKFITVEGGEGTGKSTQIELLVSALADKGLNPVKTREPGGSMGAEQIRALLVEGETGRWDGVTEALLHFAARRDHVETVIRPALAAGRWVVSDRFADSTLAYQGYGHGLDLEFVRGLYDLVLGDFSPDLTLILDIAPAEGLARATARAGGEDRYERMDITFHERLREGFLKIAASEPERCVVIDAGGEIDAVAGAMLRAVQDRLGV